MNMANKKRTFNKFRISEKERALYDSVRKK